MNRRHHHTYPTIVTSLLRDLLSRPPRRKKRAEIGVKKSRDNLPGETIRNLIGKIPHIQVCVFLQSGKVCHGNLFQKRFGLIESGQIWVKFDTSLGMKDTWILDTSIVSIQIISPERSDHILFNKAV